MTSIKLLRLLAIVVGIGMLGMIAGCEKAPATEESKPAAAAQPATEKQARDPNRLWCNEHGVYEDECVICHPEIANKKKAGATQERDPNRLWCNEHGVYEDECYICHPELKDKAAADKGHEHAPGEEHGEHDGHDHGPAQKPAADSHDDHDHGSAAGELFCKEHNLAFSRYADDLTFSSDIAISNDQILDIINIIKKNHFEINPKKLSLKTNNRKQIVTGLTVNEKVNVDRKLLKKIRAMLHDFTRNGIDTATQKHFNISTTATVHRAKFIQRLEGYINFIGLVRGKNDALYLKYQMSFDEMFTRVA